MKNIENLFTEAVDSEHFARGYLNYISYLLGRLDTRSIASFIKELEIAHRNQNTIFIAGNGGSAATATHMANDIGEIKIRYLLLAMVVLQQQQHIWLTI